MSDKLYSSKKLAGELNRIRRMSKRELEDFVNTQEWGTITFDFAMKCLVEYENWSIKWAFIVGLFAMIFGAIAACPVVYDWFPHQKSQQQKEILPQNPRPSPTDSTISPQSQETKATS